MAWQYTIRALLFNSSARDFTIFTFLGEAGPTTNPRFTWVHMQVWLGYWPQTPLTLWLATRYRRQSRLTDLPTDLLSRSATVLGDLVDSIDRLRTKRGGPAPRPLRVLLHNFSGSLAARRTLNAEPDPHPVHSRGLICRTAWGRTHNAVLHFFCSQTLYSSRRMFVGQVYEWHVRRHPAPDFFKDLTNPCHARLRTGQRRASFGSIEQRVPKPDVFKANLLGCALQCIQRRAS